MAVPVIAALPNAPDRADGSIQFDTDATVWAAALNTWTTEANALGVYSNDQAVATLAAAVAGNMSSLDLTALAGWVIGVNAAGNGLEGYELITQVQATEVAAGVAELATQAEAEAGVDDLAMMTALKTLQAIAKYKADRKFESGAQTITSGGLLTLPHGLTGITPSTKMKISLHLECITAEGGFSVGDFPPVGLAATLSGTAAQGTAIKWNATNVYVRFGSAANAFQILAYNTGARLQITNAKWKLHLLSEID